MDFDLTKSGDKVKQDFFVYALTSWHNSTKTDAIRRFWDA